jgi:uncharacterized damage-inducible protein DinB
VSFVPPDLAQIRTMARYNQWANRRLYAAAAALHEADYMRALPSFFGSLHATLNHILVGDRLWMGRLTGKADTGIRSLDQILYADLVGLRVAREAEDALIINYADELDEPTLNAALRYKTTKGDAHATPTRLVMSHLFNHQTHHRGQCHGLLSALGVKEPPELDLIFYVREMGPAA